MKQIPLQITSCLTAVAMATTISFAAVKSKPDVTPLPGSTSTEKNYSDFTKLRHEILNIIGGATSKVWIATDYLTDGEIVSALFVAMYRKLDVRVLIGRRKAHIYMSRLRYLKNQNIPVYLKPDDFTAADPSALLADDNLYMIDVELDFLTKRKQFKLVIKDKKTRENFEYLFVQAYSRKLQAIPRVLPAVGRAKHRSRASSRRFS